MKIFLFLILLSSRVYHVKAQGIINPPMAEYLVRAINEAEDTRADLIVISLDTPGGLDESMRQIVKRELNSTVPVCVYVSPHGARAASAGVFITLAAHIAAMAPGTNIGAAHPVAIGKEKMDSTMIEKVTNDAVAYLKSIAASRGRNTDWAEKAVRKSISSTEEEALKEGVIDIVANDLDELLEKVNGMKIKIDKKELILRLEEPLKIITVEMGLREKILSVLSNPTIAYILLLLGFYGIFFELSHPGAIFPGVMGAICLILAFYAFQTLPVNYAGIILILLAMILFVAEVKIQSQGLLGLGGAISFLLGSIMLFKGGGEVFRISPGTIVLATLLTTLFFLWVIAKAVQAMKKHPETGKEGLLGIEGIARTKITPKGGTVFVHGELWKAISDEDIEKGTKVKVIGVKGLTLKVKKTK